ncbi:MAG: antibiotic biosynthesis monooxygenase [Ignavibacteriales bacterium]|nr:antibiotic biosynthesis monooxygenase [Ignavibacteriales bacterium]MBI3786948.1 antibiotic biosynthesis monooxygenase [Ignavibacteriales bacterium]
MKQIFIDKFDVPKKAIEEFIPRMNYIRSFLGSLPGFIEGAVYERTKENGNAIIVTVAVWESEDAMNKAKGAVQSEFKRLGFYPGEMYARLNITIERGTYREMSFGS